MVGIGDMGIKRTQSFPPLAERPLGIKVGAHKEGVVEGRDMKGAMGRCAKHCDAGIGKVLSEKIIYFLEELR